MPTYVYGCDTCGHRFEKFQKIQDAPLTECPECGARIRRIFQPAGIVFKGSGWYSKDSRSAKTASTAEGGAAEANGGGEDGSAKSADQPAATGKGADAGTARKEPAKSESSAAAKAAE